MKINLKEFSLLAITNAVIVGVSGHLYFESKNHELYRLQVQNEILGSEYFTVVSNISGEIQDALAVPLVATYVRGIKNILQ